MADEIVWEDPPEINRSRRGVSPWERRLAPLREHPGKWANFGEHHSTAPAYIKGGGKRGATWEPGEFEAVMRGVDQATKKGTLYVRFVGES
jgi:hypothetical protein